MGIPPRFWSWLAGGLALAAIGLVAYGVESQHTTSSFDSITTVPKPHPPTTRRATSTTVAETTTTLPQFQFTAAGLTLNCDMITYVVQPGENIFTAENAQLTPTERAHLPAIFLGAKELNEERGLHDPDLIHASQVIELLNHCRVVPKPTETPLSHP